MKKAAIFIIIIMFLIPAQPLPALASGGFVVTDGVFVRETPSTSGNKLTTVNKDGSVGVLTHDPAGWSKVQAGSVTGYIRSDFLKFIIGGEPEIFRATDGVFVREAASVSSNKLTTVNQDESVAVLAHDPAGWSKVQVGSITGYIRSDFLKHPGTVTVSSASEGSAGNAPVADAPAQQTVLQVLYTAGNVNLRKAASDKSDVIRTLAKGTAVDVMANDENGWTKVRQNGTDGFISSALLTSSAQGEPQTRYINDDAVRLRAKASTSSSIIAQLSRGTAVTVLSEVSDGTHTWAHVSHNNKTGYIRGDLLSATPVAASSTPVNTVMSVIDPKGANVREGPSPTAKKVTALPYGTPVNVISHESGGWSKVSYNGATRYIFTELLGNAARVELVEMSEIKGLLPYRENIRVVDVRTGVSFNIKIFSKGTHADYEPSTRADVDAMFSTRNGVRSWAARPVWVYVGNRIFAAATHGMPHDANFIKDNGTDGHFCLHFNNATASNISYRNDLRSAVKEAYDKGPK